MPPPRWPQGHFPAKMPEHCCVPKLPLRPPIHRSGSGLAQGTLQAHAQAHSLACPPSADAAGAEVVRADTAGNVPAVMRGVSVAVEDVVGDRANTRSAEAAASRIDAGRLYCPDSMSSQHPLQAAGQAQ